MAMVNVHSAARILMNVAVAKTIVSIIHKPNSKKTVSYLQVQPPPEGLALQ
jgi:hypothetical protein